MKDKTMQNKLKLFGLQFQVLDVSTKEMEKRWEQTFLSNLSLDEKRSIHIYNEGIQKDI